MACYYLYVTNWMESLRERSEARRPEKLYTASKINWVTVWSIVVAERSMETRVVRFILDSVRCRGVSHANVNRRALSVIAWITWIIGFLSLKIFIADCCRVLLLLNQNKPPVPFDSHLIYSGSLFDKRTFRTIFSKLFYSTSIFFD